MSNKPRYTVVVTTRIRLYSRDENYKTENVCEIEVEHQAEGGDVIHVGESGYDLITTASVGAKKEWLLQKDALESAQKVREELAEQAPESGPVPVPSGDDVQF